MSGEDMSRRTLKGGDKAAKFSAVMHRLGAQDLEKPHVPRDGDRVETATNTRLRGPQGMCEV